MNPTPTRLRGLASAVCTWALLAPALPGQDIALREVRPAGFATASSGVGVSAVDFDGDRWDDVSIGLGAAPPILMRNNGDGTFTDVAPELGVTASGLEILIWADLNNDGRLDLFGAAGQHGDNVLYIRQTDGTLVDRTLEFGLDPDLRIGSAAMADVDLDGFVDLFLAVRRGHDLLLRNAAGATFEDVSEAYGIQGSPDTVPMQAVFIDYDLDADPDLLATHDLDWESRFYRNDGVGPWQEIAQQNGLAYVGPGSSMGVTWGDTNLDGALDLYISRIEFGGLYMNNGRGTFSDEAPALGAEVNGVAWGVNFLDLDNDLDEDLAIATTIRWLGNQPIALWENRGGFFHPAAEGFYPWSMGMAAGDFDRDGRQDLAVASTEGNHYLLMNASTSAHRSLAVRVGSSPLGGTPIGVRVEVDVAGRTLMRWVSGADSYCSQSSATLHFGLGQNDVVDEVRVFWSGDDVETVRDAAAGETLSFGVTSTRTADAAVPSRHAAPSVYPNPVSGMLSFRIPPGQDVVDIRILDLLGRTVKTGRVGAGVGIGRLDVAGLAQGIYLLQTTSSDVVSTSSFLVRR